MASVYQTLLDIEREGQLNPAQRTQLEGLKKQQPSSQLQVKAKGFAAETRGLLATQKAEEEKLFGRFGEAIAGQEKLPAMYQRVSGELGIPEQQQVVGGLRNEILRIEGLLEALPEDVLSRTRGTFTTEAMRRRLEAAETAPLGKQLGTVARAQERATGTLTGLLGTAGTQMGLETAQMEKELLPIKERLSAFGDRAAREITGYTSANQMELDALMEKLRMEQQLTRDEESRAHDLAVLERQFEMEKETLQTDVVTSGGRVQLVNTQTGAVIADLGASTVAKGTAEEREKTTQENALAEDAKRGMTTGGAIDIYSDKLSLSDIKRIYNENSIYGPTDMPEAEMRERYKKSEQELRVEKKETKEGFWIDDEGNMHFD